VKIITAALMAAYVLAYQGEPLTAVALGILVYGTLHYIDPRRNKAG